MCAPGDIALKAFRSTIVHCRSERQVESFDDGILLLDNGRVEAVGPASRLQPQLGESVQVVDLTGRILIPGLVDCHVHYPQSNMIASYGEQLLDWLQKYAYPEEEKFADLAHARQVAGWFADALLRNGTTTALVFATVHPGSADAMFEAAAARNMRLITGKVAMDTDCPPALRDTAERARNESQALIERWHKCGRLGYAITPRFAVTSSPEQLNALGELAERFPDVHIHTHLAEHRDELALVRRRFPGFRSYLDVYAGHGLLRSRAVFAHCLHLDESDWAQLAAADAAAAFCPSSNLFLGSGLFDLAAATDAGARVGVGSDVGGGTSLSMLRTLADGYRVLQLRQQSLSSPQGLYLATLGAARALHLEDCIGNFERGKEADFVVLDPPAGSPAGHRLAYAGSLEDRLFALMMLADDRDVHSTWLMGEAAWSR